MESLWALSRTLSCEGTRIATRLARFNVHTVGM